MQINKTTHRKTVERFWDRFTDNLLKNGLKESEVRWHIIHAEQYIKAFPERRLAGWQSIE
jgi:hypothetical protein